MMFDRPYDERHSSGLEVLSTMWGDSVDAERAARSLYRRNGPLGTFGIDMVMGDVWARPALERRDRSLIVIALLASMGNEDELRVHVEFGLNHGLGRLEIEEVVLHVAAFVGFPMAMSAMRIVSETFCRVDGVERLPARAPAASKDGPQRRRDGLQLLNSLATARGADAEELPDFFASHGDVGRLAVDWFWGEVWTRTELCSRDRHLVTIALLGWLGIREMLTRQVELALSNGVSREEIGEVFLQLAVYGGLPRAMRAYESASALM